MVELGDLREGVAVADVVDLAAACAICRGLRLAGIGTNLACQSGVVPDQHKMDELSRLAADVETAYGTGLSVVSGGNSANLEWALSTDDVGRVNELRLGEAILLGTEPLHRRPVTGLRTDAFTLTAEVIELKTKPAQPWGEIGESAFGVATAATGRWRCAPGDPGHRAAGRGPRGADLSRGHHAAGSEQRPPGGRCRRGRAGRRRPDPDGPALQRAAAGDDLALRHEGGESLVPEPGPRTLPQTWPRRPVSAACRDRSAGRAPR